MWFTLWSPHCSQVLWLTFPLRLNKETAWWKSLSSPLPWGTTEARKSVPFGESQRQMNCKFFLTLVKTMGTVFKTIFPPPFLSHINLRECPPAWETISNGNNECGSGQLAMFQGRCVNGNCLSEGQELSIIGCPISNATAADVWLPELQGSWRGVNQPEVLEVPGKSFHLTTIGTKRRVCNWVRLWSQWKCPPFPHPRDIYWNYYGGFNSQRKHPFLCLKMAQVTRFKNHNAMSLMVFSSPNKRQIGKVICFLYRFGICHVVE